LIKVIFPESNIGILFNSEPEANKREKTNDELQIIASKGKD
jgi:hypothetical protein